MPRKSGVTTSRMLEAQRAIIIENISVFTEIGRRWEKPEAELSPRASKVQEFISTRPFGCNNDKVAQLMSLVLEESIAAPGPGRRGLFVRDSGRGMTYVHLGKMRSLSGVSMPPTRKRYIRVATADEITEFLLQASGTLLRSLAAVVDHEKNRAICDVCGVEDCDCECEEEEEDDG